jgi:hypothetical protein
VVDPDDSRSSPESGEDPLLLNSPGTATLSPEAGTEERPGGVDANKAVSIAREENKSGMIMPSVSGLSLRGL